MSREGAGGKKPTAAPAAGTPIWVWAIYVVGVLGAVVFAFLLLTDDVFGVTYEVSMLAIVVWGGLILAAVVTWTIRRRQR